MAFDGLDISIGGDSAGAKGAIASVKSLLGGLERSANSAQDSVEELGDEATQSSASIGTLGATAGASLVSLLGLSSAAKGATGSLAALGVSTGTVTVALVGLAAVAAPLVATVGALAAGAASLAAVFGGGIAAGVATHMEELKTAFADARAEIMELIEPVGELFGPILVDAVEALPTLVENVLNAVGPLDEFRNALVEFGGMAMDIIPSVAGAVGDLARRALPVLMDLVDVVGNSAPGAFEAMMDVADAVGDDLLNVAQAAADLIPPLTETGVILVRVLAPAVTAVINVLGTLLSRFNAIGRSQRVQQTIQRVRGVLTDLATAVRTRVMPIVRDFADAALPRLRDAADTARQDFVPLIDEVRSLADEVRKTANVVIPILAERFGPAIDSFGRLAVDAFELIATTVSNAFDIAINTLEVVVALMRGDFDAALRNSRDLAKTVTDAIGENFNAMKDVVVSAVRFLVDTVVGRFQALADILLGEGVVDRITNGLNSAFRAVDFSLLTDPLDTVTRLVGDLMDAINNLLDTDIDIDLPSVPGFGGGGDNSGGGSSGGGGGGVGAAPAPVRPAAAALQSPPPPTPASRGGGASASQFNESSVEDISRKLDDVVAAVSALNQGDVRQEDVLRALDVADDRRSGRNFRE